MKDSSDMTATSIDKTQIRQLTGSCLCSGVAYKIIGPARDVVNCYCSQCRKTSGHYVAATRINKDHLNLTNEKSLTWFECLPNIFRGFCNSCGGNLFWDNKNVSINEISVMAGTLDVPTHLKTVENIFTEDASDYCQIADIEAIKSTEN